MIIVRHRINTVEGLHQVPSRHGVEIDVRGYGKRLILNHEPLVSGERLDSFLRQFRHRFCIFNVKEAGIETRIHQLAERHKVSDYFLLDVEFPYLWQAAHQGEKRIAIRYSEDESLETVLRFTSKVNWVWIDTVTTLPLNREIVQKLRPFKTALVCPERWGRPDDIPAYLEQMRQLNFQPDLVMTSEACVKFYE